MSVKPCREKWPGKMTDRERFNNQMHYKPFDRCFNMEFGYWDENFKEWDIFVEKGIKDNSQAHEFFNFDRIELHEYPWMVPPFEQKVVEETEDKKIIINQDGLLAEVPKNDQTTIPHFIKSSITTPEDWKKCKNERLRRDDPARKPDIEALKKLYPADRDFPVGIWCGSMIGKIRDLLTFEGLAYATFDHPGMIEDMVETCCVLVEDYLDAVLGHIDFDFAWGWEDICFKSGPIVSVDFFKKVVAPRYKRINEKLKAHGIDIWFTDCDGDIRPILPTLLESGINTMFPFEVNCSGHPTELLAEYGKDLRIMGGFDKMALGEGPDAIRSYMESLIPYVERGGFIPFCDHRCPPNVKPEDYIFYLDLKQKTFGQLD
ncbi:Uroporphyrinogen decarboxylase (URO-D) [Anaerohalosphaera lusitana]|uniref:Uroporphyrinogen decarboxylase (URO-D) n=1 Tax=Anaerohalosphaera lusitana TaxID=1936003 RepID=A0A1U9NHW4_9BACT|nr:uroporphyrinogen decarboxylase family protein [Anaerohalosphaera lusitana]AQT67405.1 Uroporphyrinogen decarboxylase (URO-D) [Anaerohalosphaera lusitana]